MSGYIREGQGSAVIKLILGRDGGRYGLWWRTVEDVCVKGQREPQVRGY